MMMMKRVEYLLCRTAFRRELSRLNHLQHPHLVRLIGACGGGDDRLCGIVVEYPTYGDLKRFLRQQRAVDHAGTSSRRTLSSSAGVTSVTSDASSFGRSLVGDVVTQQGPVRSVT